MQEVILSNYIIYKAENVFTGEVYVGATSKSISDRRKDHIQKSENGSGNFFHQAILTYGADSFVWSELDVAYSIQELAEKEAIYVFEYDSFKSGYNSNSGGGFKKSVFQYCIETGKLIKSYPDLESAANAVSANKKSISNCCLNYCKTCKGFIWSYSDALDVISNLDLRKKTVNQISLDGDLIACYESATEASRKTGISKTCITRCCRKEREQSGGFLWKYS